MASSMGREFIGMDILSESDQAEAVAIVCASFRDYPVMRYVLKSSGSAYEKHLHMLIDSFCERRL